MFQSAILCTACIVVNNSFRVHNCVFQIPTLTTTVVWLSDRQNGFRCVHVSSTKNIMYRWTPTAKYADARKLREQHAEKLWRSGGQKMPKDLAIWWQRTTRYSLKSKSRETITNMLRSCKTWQLNGFKLTKQRQIKKRTEVLEKWYTHHAQLSGVVQSLRRTSLSTSEKKKPSSVLVQSGLQGRWRTEATKFYWNLWNALGPTGKWPDAWWTSR